MLRGNRAFQIQPRNDAEIEAPHLIQAAAWGLDMYDNLVTEEHSGTEDVLKEERSKHNKLEPKTKTRSSEGKDSLSLPLCLLALV